MFLLIHIISLKKKNIFREWPFLNIIYKINICLSKDRQINVRTCYVNIYYAYLKREHCSCTFYNPGNLLPVDLLIFIDMTTFDIL